MTQSIAPFRSTFAQDMFNNKYKHEGAETWDELAVTLVEDVVGDRMCKEDKDDLVEAIRTMKFIPGGRYLYYAGREIKAYSNCYLLRAEEDTREDWAMLSWKAESCLSTGGGIGIDYSVYRPRNAPLKRTGGVASGPISKARMINEIGREVMQGGSRRSAIYGSLHWKHPDAEDWIYAKDWANMAVPGTTLSLKDLKENDFNWPCPLDMTNISLNYDDEFLATDPETNDIWLQNCLMACKTGEPGMSFNFGDKARETLRNAPLSGDTWVTTDVGPQRIKDIVGEAVRVWTSKQWAETTFVRTKRDVQTVALKLSNGRTIKADPEHEFFISETEKVRTDALKVGDVLWTSSPNIEEFPLDARGYLYGYTHGDGSFTKRYPRRAEITFCTNASKFCANVIRELPEVQSVTEEDGRGFLRVYLKDDWFIGRNKFECPMDLELHQVPSFIAGLFDSDGSYDPNQQAVRLSCVNYSFLEGVARWLDRIGIGSSISLNGKSTYGQRETYVLRIAGSSVPKFQKLIPTQRLKLLAEDYAPYRKSVVKVLSIAPGDIEDVFCCDVGVEEHSFMAEGVIVSNCCEVVSEDDSDVCNIGSINLSRIEDIEELAAVCYLASQFLYCGTLKATLPYDKVAVTRAKNKRQGLGLMGVHEWLLAHGSRYEVTPELHEWLAVWKQNSEDGANDLADSLGLSRPVAYRAIAPTGTIGIMAGTTTGIEPLFAVAYKRRYLKDGTDWHYQYVVDSAADALIERYNLDPDQIESALDLAGDVERRIKFQADVQDYVDMAISSTINLPEWGSPLNNEDTVADFAATLFKYAPRLRGFTVYPSNARGGQPLTSMPYKFVKDRVGVEYRDHDSCKGGVCGV